MGLCHPVRLNCKPFKRMYTSAHVVHTLRKQRAIATIDSVNESYVMIHILDLQSFFSFNKFDVFSLHTKKQRTIATIDTVKDGGTVELIVGEGLQKAVRASAIGKLAPALHDFVRDSSSSAPAGGKRHSVPNLKEGHVKPLKSLADSEVWGGLGVDHQLLARLRELEMQERLV